MFYTSAIRKSLKSFLKMNSIAIFGGTFNPIHNGHVNLVKELVKAIEIDRLIIMPTKIPPHKKALNLAIEADRLQMCRLAFENMDKIEISDYEINHPGKSFSVLTLRYFREQFPDAKLYFVMGSDMFLSFDTWHEYKEILRLATLVAVSRNNEDTQRILDYQRNIEQWGGESIVVPIKPYEVSSSQVRDAIAQNEEYSCYLPEKVVKYIKCNNLYRSI